MQVHFSLLLKIEICIKNKIR